MFEMRAQALRDFLDEPLPAMLATVASGRQSLHDPALVPVGRAKCRTTSIRFTVRRRGTPGSLGGETSTWVRHLQHDSADVALHRRRRPAGDARGD